MARVTVEDCIDKVENRFDLVLLASHRARMISSGQQITVDRDNDKNPVVALREIAESTLKPEDLKEEFIHSLQKHVEVDEPEAEVVPSIASIDPLASDAQGDVPFDRMTEEGPWYALGDGETFEDMIFTALMCRGAIHCPECREPVSVSEESLGKLTGGVDLSVARREGTMRLSSSP